MIGIRDVAKLVAPTADRVKMSICRAVLRLVNDGAGLQSVQVEAMKDDLRDGAERFQNYGFTSHPHPGAECVALAVGGSTSHTVVICVDDRRYRLKAMPAGEVAIYDDLDQVVHLKRDEVLVSSPAKVRIAAPEIVMEATTRLRLQSPVIEMHAPAGGAETAPRIKADVNGYGWNMVFDVAAGKYRTDTWQTGPLVVPGTPSAPAPPEHTP